MPGCEEVHPHARHLLRTEDWLLELDGDAGEGLRLAAVLHDIERAFPDADADLGLRPRLGLAGVQPLASGPLRADRLGLAARAGSAGLAGRGDRRADPRARGRRLARGRPAAGGRLALLPGDHGAARDRLGARAVARRASAPLPSSRARWIAWRRTCTARASSPRPTSRPALAAVARAPEGVAAASDRGIVRPGQPAADAAAPTPRQRAGGDAAGARRARLPARPRALPEDAAVPGPSDVRGAVLSHAAGHPRRRRRAVGRAQRRLLGLHERVGHGYHAHRRAHRRPRAHDGRRRRPLARRLGADHSSGTSGRSPAMPPRSRRCGAAACSTTSPDTAA